MLSALSDFNSIGPWTRLKVYLQWGYRFNIKMEIKVKYQDSMIPGLRLKSRPYKIQAWTRNGNILLKYSSLMSHLASESYFSCFIIKWNWDMNHGVLYFIILVMGIYNIVVSKFVLPFISKALSLCLTWH